MSGPVKRGNELGEVGRACAANVRRIRRVRGLTTKQLADALTAHGRPVHATAITKIEQGDRRVDVDDLVALASALNVAVDRLLSPPEPCATCEGTPPVGFVCKECGAEA